MKKAGFVFGNFKNFLHFHRNRLIVIYVLTIFLAFTQGVSFVMLIPLLNLLNVSGSIDDSFIHQVLLNVSEALQLELTLEVLLVFYVIVLTVLFLLQYGRAILQSAYQQRYSGHVRQDLYRKVIFSDWSFLTSMGKAEHLQTLTSEIPRATHFYFYLLSASTKGVILIIHTAIACFVSWKLTFFVLAWGLLQFWILSKYFTKSYQLGQRGRKTFRKVLKNIDDFWITVKPAKIHNTEQFYFDNFAKADDGFVSNQVEQFRHNQRPQILFRMLGLVNMVAVVLISQYYLSIPLPYLFVLVLLFSRIMPLFMNAYSDVNLMYLNAESLEHLQKVYANAGSHLKVVNVEVAENADLSDFGQIEIKNLSFGYNDKSSVFTDFCARIPQCEISAIVGESGSGKTTLIDLVSGLLVPQSGVITYGQIEMNPENASFIRKRIGYLPQESLFIDGTLRDNLVWDADGFIRDEDIHSVLESVNASAFLKQKEMTLDEDVTNFRFCFSGGELQRLALARVLLRKPQILILDEATSALDEKNEDVIIELLQKLKSTTTIIFITHKRRLQEKFDNVIYLK